MNVRCLTGCPPPYLPGLRPAVVQQQPRRCFSEDGNIAPAYYILDIFRIGDYTGQPYFIGVVGVAAGVFPWGNSPAVCWKLPAGHNFPPRLRPMREKETAITFFAAERLIADSDLPIRSMWALRPA